MKKNVLFKMTLVIALFLYADRLWAQFPDPFLSEAETPKGSWIPAPPSLTDGSFADDFYYYQWGRNKRSEEGVSELALSDESTPLYQVFSEAMGIELSQTNTPEIIFLAESAASDATRANTAIKNYYQRIRPFVRFNEPSLKEWEDDKEALTFSYPSGHSSRGYMYAMVLSTVAPERTDSLMARAVLYAINRVICGHHWKSDTNAALLLQAGVFANVVVSEKYQKQLVKAREEYNRLKNYQTGIRTAQPEGGQAKIYDLQGRQLNGEPSKSGVYISNGKKIVNQN